MKNPIGCDSCKKKEERIEELEDLFVLLLENYLLKEKEKTKMFNKRLTLRQAANKADLDYEKYLKTGERKSTYIVIDKDSNKEYVIIRKEYFMKELDIEVGEDDETD